MDLVIASNNQTHPLTLDLTNFLQVADGGGMDPYDPTFTNKVISHSLLKEGGVLALEDLQAKETTWPLLLEAANAPALALLVQEINQIVTYAGATCSWTDDGMSQPTVFDLISGQFDVAYSYRQAQRCYCKGNLRIFSQPLGRVAGSRHYAAASGPAPLLIVSPYSPVTGAMVIGATTQASVAGFGGAPLGASSGIFYPGAPSLAGDAGALLQLAYTVGPSGAAPSMTAVSLLPDQFYEPIPALALLGGTSYGASVPGGIVHTMAGPAAGVGLVIFEAAYGGAESPTPQSWAGNHRMLALARASGAAGILSTAVDTLVPTAGVASVPAGSGWGLYDLGTFVLRASEAPGQPVVVNASVNSGAALDISQIYVLPDSNTWWFQNTPNAYIVGGNVIVLDDYLQDQYILPSNLTQAPYPVTPFQGERITQYSRGLPPRPNPQNGLPVLAVLAVGGSQVYPQAQLTAQVEVIERTRYVLP